MLSGVRGLVLRATDIGESDRLLTVYTEERGLITAMAKGARSLKSRLMAVSTLYCFAEFVLYEKGEHLWVREGTVIESFFDIRSSLAGLALAGYICEVMLAVTVEEPDRDLLRLALNSLYAIAGKKYPLPTVKAAFEVRISALLGFMPDILGCRACGERHGDFSFDITDGNLLCSACRAKLPDLPYEAPEERHAVALLSEGAKTAMNYLVYAPLERLFSFRIPKEDEDLLSVAAEMFLLNHIERSFRSLEFYKEVTR